MKKTLKKRDKNGRLLQNLQSNSERKKGYWPGRILQRRGELAASITSKYDENSAVVGTNKIYAAIHQFGGNAGRGEKVQIPASPFLQVDSDLILIEVKKYLI